MKEQNLEIESRKSVGDRTSTESERKLRNTTKGLLSVDKTTYLFCQ